MNFVKFMQFPIAHPLRFFWVALGFSFIFGIRGIVIQLRNVPNENSEARQHGLRGWTRRQMLFVQCYQDFIYNLAGSMAGWIALYLLTFRLMTPVPDKTGTLIPATLNLQSLGFADLTLSIFALLGITCKLPQTIEGFINSFARIVEAIAGKFGSK